jgi:hypothetical protein
VTAWALAFRAPERIRHNTIDSECGKIKADLTVPTARGIETPAEFGRAGLRPMGVSTALGYGTGGAASRRELVEVGRKIDAILRALEDGIYTAATRGHLLALEARKAELEAVTPPEPVPRLHPGIAEIYREKVANLHAALSHPDTRIEAAAAIRALIERIVLYPGENRGEVRAELYGELAAILALCENKTKPVPPMPREYGSRWLRGRATAEALVCPP